MRSRIGKGTKVTGRDQRTYQAGGLTSGNAGDGQMYHPVGTDGKAVPARELTEYEDKVLREREDRKRDWAERNCNRIWAEASRGDRSRIAQYLEGRGIPVADLPGAVVPRQLRFGNHVPDGYLLDERGEPRVGKDGRKVIRYAPAMVARIQPLERKKKGENLCKSVHATYIDGAKKRSEADGSKARRLHGRFGGGLCVPLFTTLATRTLLIGEGIETVLSAMAATKHPGIACLARSGLTTLALPWGLVDRTNDRGIKRIVILGDLDKSGDGQKDAAYAAKRLAEAYPWINVQLALPGFTTCPELVESDRGGDGRSVPRGDAKSVDMNDVLRACGADRLRSVIDGAPVIEPKNPLAGEYSRDRAAGPAESLVPTPYTPQQNATGTRARPVSLEGEGGRGSGGGQGGDGDGGRGRPVIEPNHLTCARRFLRDRCGGPGRRYALGRWGGKWYRWRGRGWVEQEDERLRAETLDYLNRFDVWRRGGQAPLNPEVGFAGNVVAALVADTYIASDRMPAWLPPVLADDGDLMPGASLTYGPNWKPDDKPDASRMFAFSDGVLAFEPLLDGEIVVLPHSTDLFVTSVRPYPLDVDSLRELLAAEGTDEQIAIYERLCPNWMRVLERLESQTPGGTRALQLMFGDTIGHDRSIEKIFGLQGPTRSLKGTIMEALTTVVGDENVANLQLESFADKHGMAEAPGKSVIWIDEAQADRWSSPAVTMLKKISGQSAVSIRDLYTRSRSILLTARIWVTCNDPPDLHDSSGALAGRFVWIPTGASLLGQEDPTIKRGIPREAPGIALWAIMGAIDLWQMPLPRIDPPERGAELGRAYMESTAPMSAFISQWCEVGAGKEVGMERLWRAYRLWSEQSGGDGKIRLQKFGVKLRGVVTVGDRHPTDTDTGKRVRVYTGIGLTLAAETELDQHENRSGGSPQAGSGRDDGWQGSF